VVDATESDSLMAASSGRGAFALRNGRVYSSSSRRKSGRGTVASIELAGIPTYSFPCRLRQQCCFVALQTPALDRGCPGRQSRGGC